MDATYIVETVKTIGEIASSLMTTLETDATITELVVALTGAALAEEVVLHHSTAEGSPDMGLMALELGE